MRMACISDLHLTDTVAGRPGHEVLDDWLAALNGDGDVDHILVAGDLAGTFEDPRSSRAFDEFRRRLVRHGWYEPNRVSIVPGNHDTRVCGNVLPVDINFHRTFRKLFSGRSLPSPYYFPHVKPLEGVHIIALDTASGWWRFHGGCLGSEQVAALETTLRRSSVTKTHVIVVMHHPPRESAFGDLHDADEFWATVNAANVDLIVCGHDHDNWEDRMHGVPVVCVGGFLHGDQHALIVDAGEGSLDYFWWAP